MITSAQTSLLSELRQAPIPKATLVELLARLENRIHSMILESFNKSGLSQRQIAERLGWDEGRVSRCLGGSSNWTLKTINALMAAIGIDLDDPTYTTLEELEKRLRAQTTISAGVSTASGEKNRPQSAKRDDMAGHPHNDGQEGLNLVVNERKQPIRRSGVHRLPGAQRTTTKKRPRQRP